MSSARCGFPREYASRRHKDDQRPTHFEYNGVRFGQDTLNVFAGLCAVDNRKHVEIMIKAVHDNGQVCTRMGAYKPRTSPYAFQGHGKAACRMCSNWQKIRIKVIGTEITHESHLMRSRRHCTRRQSDRCDAADRHAQHAELRIAEDRRAQTEMPILLKRGFGITLDESLNAAEYLASEGNRNVVFGLRMKTNMGDPHRNFVDFSHVPVVKRLRGCRCASTRRTRWARVPPPGRHPRHDARHRAGIVAGANMVLVDFHPAPPKALVAGREAMLLKEFPYFLEAVHRARGLSQAVGYASGKCDFEAGKDETCATPDVQQNAHQAHRRRFILRKSQG